MATYQAIRGMNDIVPEQTRLWQWVESVLKEVAEHYGYREIRFPLVESLALFKRTIGEVTDIVEKEMYTFDDRNGEQLALRPEGTACCVRAGIEHGLFYNQTQKLWYMGPMFRYERPQKGRYRQFFHFGLEAFGYGGADIDAEILLLTARLWRKLGLAQHIQLEINSLGSTAARNDYRGHLVRYYEAHRDQLDEDSLRRLYSNPLRILDSKNPGMQALNKNAPKLNDYLDEGSKQHLTKLCRLLESAGVAYNINPQLVRGLDYYNGVVFEWVTSHLGAQGTVCAGGRYDNLVEQLGGKPTSAIGLAIGLERLILLVEQIAMPAIKDETDIFIIALGDEAANRSLLLAEQLRSHSPWHITTNLGEGSLKTQMKRADKSGAKIALIIGEEEIKQNTVVIKYLREDKPQQVIEMEKLMESGNLFDE